MDMEYDIQYSTPCLRFVFYDQVMMTVRDALNCVDVNCAYGISIVLVMKERGEHDGHHFDFCGTSFVSLGCSENM